MSRVHHPYTVWEDFRGGMYAPSSRPADAGPARAGPWKEAMTQQGGHHSVFAFEQAITATSHGTRFAAANGLG